MNCKHCNHNVTENYCANCGQAVTLKRIDKHYISHELLHLFHFEKGLFYTIKELFVRPGDSIKTYLKTDRTKHMKPIAFLILTSLLFTWLSHLFHVDELYNSKEKIQFGKSHVGDIMHWMQTHYGYANIIEGFFIAILVKVLFKKYGYNFYEIMILLCFISGQAMILFTIQTFFVGIMNEQVFRAFILIFGFAYPIFVIAQFFDKRKVISYIKALFAYILGYLLFTFSYVVVGLIADVVTMVINKNH